MGGTYSAASRESFRLAAAGEPTLALQVQRPRSATAASPASGDVVYVHGGTFGADLSIFYRFDGRSWADALNDIGLIVWGLDFPGYGGSDRARGMPTGPFPWFRIPGGRRSLHATRRRIHRM
jgi:alpha-beta hydrolase superfamily lysophospholipase